MSHPHPSRRHIVQSYRRFLLGEKRRIAGVTNNPANFRRGARSLIHYADYVLEYLEAKRDAVKGREE